jgi:hypothetical protein
LIIVGQVLSCYAESTVIFRVVKCGVQPIVGKIFSHPPHKTVFQHVMKSVVAGSVVVVASLRTDSAGWRTNSAVLAALANVTILLFVMLVAISAIVV